MSSGPTYLKKITTATIGLSPKAMNAIATDEAMADKMPARVMRVYGTVRGQKKGTSNFGPWIGFLGEFESVNLIDGKKFRSKTLMLPSVGEMALSDALDEAKSKNPDAFIEFGLDVIVEKNESSKGGWEFKYGIIPLKSPEFQGESDTLAILGKSLGEMPILLNAPQNRGKNKK